MREQNKTFIFLLTLFILSALPIFSLGSKAVVLYGKAPSYKNDQLEFYRYSDYITKKTEPLATATVDNKGNFKCHFEISNTQKIFSNLGAYKGYLFVEPGQKYNLVLPEKKKKTKAQQMNPYFEGISFHIGIKSTSKDHLNQNIYSFLKEYNHVINENLNRIYASTKIIDSLSLYLDTIIQFDHAFFNRYKKYKLFQFKSVNHKGISSSLQNIFDDDIYYYNPAYMELFNEEFGNYFADYFSKFGTSIYRTINYNQSIHELDSLLQKDTTLSDHMKLRELVILKGLYDAFYTNKFSKKAIIQMIDTFPDISEVSYHKTIAGNIYDKITQLRVGNEPPDFCLYDSDSNLVCLDSLKGNYIYLGFCNSMNYSCLRDYKILHNLYKKHKSHFKMIIVSTENHFEAMKQLKEQKDIPWTMLHYGNDPEIIKKYNVKVMPTYYFINPEGTLSLSPAPGPSEKIEWEIFKKMRKKGDL